MNVFSEKFADIKMLRFEVPGFEVFDLQRKMYIYYLSQAALCGRDILWDQNNQYNLRIRAVLEHIFKTFRGDRETDSFRLFTIYLKRVWFANGIHHHYSSEKFSPGFEATYFDELLEEADWNGFPFPEGGHAETFFAELKEVIFDPEKEHKRVCLDAEKDLIKASATNYYQGLNQEEAENFYAGLKDGMGAESSSFGLNSTLVKIDGNVQEQVWKADGKYGKAIQQIVFWLKKASDYTENNLQKSCITHLINFYTTGDLKHFDLYNIYWVKELDGEIDFVNGFIEVYGDPLGIKGSWESIVNFKDLKATKRAEILSYNAQWFEDHSPVDPKFKKAKVKGVSAKVINVAILGGDCYPATPIGINLPNAEWIREKHGSKSVTIENITHSYFIDSLTNGMLEEFAFTTEEIERARKYGYLAGNLHTDLHECLGHGSGKLLEGIGAEQLKNYHSTIEETRADLFALYFMMDEKMIELELIPSIEAAKAEYDAYLRAGLLTQLTRIEIGKDLEESHMRNRQLISRWVYEKGKENKVVELVQSGKKTYVKINNYNALHDLFGNLLQEIQRVKSEGDFEAAKQLVESYGVKVDKSLHHEVIDRFNKLNVAPYAGFINPVYTLKKWPCDSPADVLISNEENYTDQMLRYSREYGFLDLIN